MSFKKAGLTFLFLLPLLFALNVSPNNYIPDYSLNFNTLSTQLQNQNVLIQNQSLLIQKNTDADALILRQEVAQLNAFFVTLFLTQTIVIGLLIIVVLYFYSKGVFFNTRKIENLELESEGEESKKEVV